jgi:hypothetical protein
VFKLFLTIAAAFAEAERDRILSASGNRRPIRRPVADTSAGLCHLVSGAATMANSSRMRTSKRRSRKWSLCGRRESR